MRQEPLLRRRRIGDGLLRRERLGCDNEEGGLCVQRLQRLGQVGAVDVGDEVDIGAGLVGLQGLGDHEGAEVGAADPDVDHIRDGFARVACPRAGDYLWRGKSQRRAVMC